MDLILRKSLSSMNQYMLIKLPDSPVWPHEFLELNNANIQEMIKLITKKSIFSEKIFLSIIESILYRLHDKYSFKDDKDKFNFFDVTLALDDIRDTDRELRRDGEFFTNKCILRYDYKCV